MDGRGDRPGARQRAHELEEGVGAPPERGGDGGAEGEQGGQRGERVALLPPGLGRQIHTHGGMVPHTGRRAPPRRLW